MLPLPIARTYEEGFPLETGILRFRNNAIPVSCGSGADTVYSFTPWYGLEEPVSVLRSCTGTSRYTGRPERPGHGLRQRTRPIGRDVSTPSHHQLSPQTSRSYRVRFCYLAYGQECYLILVLRIHSLPH